MDKPPPNPLQRRGKERSSFFQGIVKFQNFISNK